MNSTLYQMLVDTLAAQIRSGQLPPGTRLPTHRQLARQHGLALTTATRVYAELEALGLARGEVGRGTFVRETAVPSELAVDQQAVTAGMVDLNFNYPALPQQARLLSQGLRRLAAGGDLEALLRYAPHGGRPHERACVAQHLASRGLAMDPAQVLIVDGAQHGLAVAGMALLQPGDLVAVDTLTYPGFKVLADLLRLELTPLPAADQGFDLEALQRLCARRRVRAVYTMPTLHNPLGWVGSADWRQGLAAIVRRHGLIAIEDAAYAFLAEGKDCKECILTVGIKTPWQSGDVHFVDTGHAQAAHSPGQCATAQRLYVGARGDHCLERRVHEHDFVEPGSAPITAVTTFRTANRLEAANIFQRCRALAVGAQHPHQALRHNAYQRSLDQIMSNAQLL